MATGFPWGAIVCLLYLLMLDTVSNLMLVFYSLDRIRTIYKRKGNYSIISLIVEITASPLCVQHKEPQAMELIYAEMFSGLCDYVPFCVEYTVVNQQKALCEFVNSC